MNMNDSKMNIIVSLHFANATSMLEYALFKLNFASVVLKKIDLYKY